MREPKKKERKRMSTVQIIEALAKAGNLSDDQVKEALKGISPSDIPARWGGTKAAERSLTSYNIFVKEKSAEARKMFPEEKNPLVAASRMWKGLSEEERKVYTGDKTPSSTKKPTKTTAWNVFLREEREHCKDMTYKDYVAMQSGVWAEMSEEDKKVYKAIADKENEGKAEAIEEYQKTMPKKKLSPTEQAKADQPDLYEFNPVTGRYNKRKGVKLPPKEAPKPAPETKKEKKPKKSKSKSETESEVELSDEEV